MGQELLEIPDSQWRRNRTTYYLATNSKGHKVVRGTSHKTYTHATIYGNLYTSGYCYATFTTREDLAKRYSKRWEGSEVVEVKLITPKEARQLKKEIIATAIQYQEQETNRTAHVYQIERENTDD